MQLHQLQPKHKSQKAKRVGRGGKRGVYSGRGVKGQSARAGRKMRPAIRDLIKRYPKLRGYRFRLKIKNQKSKIAIVDLEILEKEFGPGEKVTPQSLLEKGIIDRIKGEAPRVKILGKSQLTKALTVEDCLVSKKAKEAIEKAGGKVEILNVKNNFAF